ncbi:hypothetical protein ACFL4N_03785 [Thermodesulfobacteriota bacterium]
MESYRLTKAVRSERLGIVEHKVLLPGVQEHRTFRYYAVRIGLVWPTAESPGYFLVGGAEVYNEQITPCERAQVRILEQVEIPELSLGRLFDAVTSAYVAHLCDSIYVDFEVVDYLNGLYDYLDQHKLRTVSVYDAPFKDLGYRFSVVGDFNDTGDLVLDKDTQLYRDLQGVSRAHLLNNPEVKFYRLNALSYLLAGFSKYTPGPSMFLDPGLGKGAPGWML